MLPPGGLSGQTEEALRMRGSIWGDFEKSGFIRRRMGGGHKVRRGSANGSA